MADFTVSPLAADDLDEIWHYISEYNEPAADKFMRDLAAKFQILADTKEIGKTILLSR